MSGIYGLFHRRGAPVEPAALKAMEEAMSVWGPDGHGIWREGPVGLGQMLLYNTPEALYERLPRWVPEQKLAFTAEARIDNRDELCDAFGISPVDRPKTPDGDLILKSYLKWGEDCPNRLLGDWSFAVWHPEERRLFLARDHHGNTSLYYYYDGKLFAFASDKQALLALPQIPQALNVLKIAQILVSWHADGVQTVYEAIQHLPPSRTLTITPENLLKRRYWILENTPMLPAMSNEDYIDGFLDVYKAAVRCRLRSYRPVGANLSGGLDSGSIVAVAAKGLRTQNSRLPVFTSVPLYGVETTVGKNRFGDEGPLAKATADFVGNVDQAFVRAENVSPLSGIRRMLDIHDEPGHAAANSYWIVNLLEMARARGIGTLLTGQGGNATISWVGRNSIPRFSTFLRERAYGRILKHKIVRPLLPAQVIRRYRIRQITKSWKLAKQPWLAYSAIHPDFARRIDLASIMADAGHDPYFLTEWPGSRKARLAIIQPSSSTLGAKKAENGARFDIESRDPTMDKRVMEYCLGLPDEIYQYEGTLGRGLIRRAMIGYLPEQVRLNRRRGLQAADIGERIKHESSEINSVLDQLAVSSIIREVLDLERMAMVLRSIESRIDENATMKSRSILLRGLAVGMFLTRHKYCKIDLQSKNKESNQNGRKKEGLGGN